MGTTFLNIINKSVFYLFLFQVCVKALYLTLGTLGPAVVSNFVSPLFPQDFLPPPSARYQEMRRNLVCRGPSSPPARLAISPEKSRSPTSISRKVESRLSHPILNEGEEGGGERRGELRRRVINLEQVLLDLVAGKKRLFCLPFPFKGRHLFAKKYSQPSFSAELGSISSGFH